MEDIVERAVYAVEVSLRKDGIDLDVTDSDDIRDELQRILEHHGYFE